MQILDYLKGKIATARDAVSSQKGTPGLKCSEFVNSPTTIEKNGTGIKYPNYAAARGRSTGLLPVDHLEGDSSPSIYSPDFAWSESDCKLFVLALSKLKQKEARILVARVLV